VAADLPPSGLVMVGVMPSPIRGASGNVEFFGHFAIGRPAAAVGRAELEAAVVEAHASEAPSPGPVTG
jgi:hypothetical protein